MNRARARSRKPVSALRRGCIAFQWTTIIVSMAFILIFTIEPLLNK